MSDLINLDKITSEVTINQSQLCALIDRYGCEGMKALEQQILQRGLVIERRDDAMSLGVIRIRPARLLGE